MPATSRTCSQNQQPFRPRPTFISSPEAFAFGLTQVLAHPADEAADLDALWRCEVEHLHQREYANMASAAAAGSTPLSAPLQAPSGSQPHAAGGPACAADVAMGGVT